MWDDDDKVEVHANDLSKSSGFSLDDAFSEDDGVIDATLEFNPAAIRAALARTLAAGESESTGSQNGADHSGGSTGGRAFSINPNHSLNGSMEKDSDTSVSTLDINASPVHVPGRSPEEWSRSTSYSHGYEYKRDGPQSASGTESLTNFSMISLGDSVEDLESVEISLELPEEGVEEEEGEGVVVDKADEELFRAVHIDLSQGGKPRVEEIAARLPETPNPDAPDREGRTPSPGHTPTSSLQSTSNGNHNTYTPSPTSPHTPKTSQSRQNWSRSAQDLRSPTTSHSAENAGTSDKSDHLLPDSAGSAGTTFSDSSLGHASSKTTSGLVRSPSSTASPPNSSQSEPPRYKHRHTRSVGPSTLDKVISKTRPTFLPPKPKTEDLKHLADWESMMKQSRAVGEFHFYSFVPPSFCFLCFWRIQAY